jgi:ABC-2 type transport system ATP-binding protein
MSHPALSFEGVSRSFGRKVALDDVSIRVEPGTVLGLVGSNGAGKTTALRLAHGLLFPDGGRIEVLGLDPARDGREVRTRVSLLSEESSLYPWMRVSEIVRFAAALHPRFDLEHAESLRGRLDLDPHAKIGTLSRGTRAKVALVLAVAARPDLLLLDDPTAGLDPLVRREVLEGILDAVPAEGGAVVYASHLVHDVERVVDRVAVMDGGRLRLQGSLDEVKARVRRATAVFEGGAPEDATIEGRIVARADGRVLTVVAEGENGQLAGSLRSLGATSVEVESLSLEDILVALLDRGAAKEVRHA